MYQLVETLNESQIHQLKQLYDGEWWCQNRSVDEIRTMLQHSSLILGIVNQQQELVAFCRLLTDFVFRATLYDVIVRADHRGTGLGKQLLDAVNQHPRLQSVRTMGLYCTSDKIPFYQKWDFQIFDEEPHLMVKRLREG